MTDQYHWVIHTLAFVGYVYWGSVVFNAYNPDFVRKVKRTWVRPTIVHTAKGEFMIEKLTPENVDKVVKATGGTKLLKDRLEGELEVAENRDCELWVRYDHEEIDWQFVSLNIYHHASTSEVKDLVEAEFEYKDVKETNGR